jgi:hypothetical protein
VLVLVASCTCAPVNQNIGFWCRFWKIFCSTSSEIFLVSTEINSSDETTESYDTAQNSENHESVSTQNQFEDLKMLEEENESQKEFILNSAPVTCREGQSKDFNGNCKQNFPNKGNTLHSGISPTTLVTSRCREGYREDKFGVCRKIFSK